MEKLYLKKNKHLDVLDLQNDGYELCVLRLKCQDVGGWWLQASLLPIPKVRGRFKSDTMKGVLNNDVNSVPPVAIRKRSDKYMYKTYIYTHIRYDLISLNVYFCPN